MGPSRSENVLGLWLPPKQQVLMRFLINDPCAAHELTQSIAA